MDNFITYKFKKLNFDFRTFFEKLILKLFHKRSALKIAFFSSSRGFLFFLIEIEQCLFDFFKIRNWGREIFNCLAWDIGEEKLGESLNLDCRRFGLHACSAHSNLSIFFINAIEGTKNIRPSTQLLAGNEDKSIFKIKIYFSYAHKDNSKHNAQTTLYSKDYPAERNEIPGTRSKSHFDYNGFRYLIYFCLRLAKNGDLFYARIYANQIEGKPELLYIDPSNIHLLMSKLTSNNA